MAGMQQCCCCSSSSSQTAAAAAPTPARRRFRLQRQQLRASAAAVLLLALLSQLSAAAAAAAGAAAAADAPRRQQLPHADGGGSRRLLIRPMPSGAGACRNTRQGPWLMADDQGRVCAAGELDYGSGCCRGRGSKRHACDACDARDGCCEAFEHCVSCCMAPANKPEERRKATPRRPNDEASGLWADDFELCTWLCRTHAFSTSHENAYIGARHHCYSRLGKPMLSPPLPPGALDGVTVLVGAAGASCEAACQGHADRLACSQEHLHLLNSCDRLREHLACEAGCDEEALSPAAPAAVDPEAPKQERPAICLVADAGGRDGREKKQPAFTCDAAANHIRRLCACVAPPKGGGDDKQAAGGDAAAGGAEQDDKEAGAENNDAADGG